MPRPIQAFIDIAALRQNLDAARRRAGDRRVWAVIKADAYGHGIQRALAAFDAADGIALLDFDEAQRVRDAGWIKPILLLEGFFSPADFELAAKLGLTMTVHSFEQLKMMEMSTGSTPVEVYFKINTGMNRLGFAPEDAPQAYSRLKAMPRVRIAAISMHFANSERPDMAAGPVSISGQIEQFNQVAHALPEDRSMSNSAALFFHSQISDNWVRPGIALYGGTPDGAHTAAAMGLRAGMHLRSEIIATQQLRAGEGVGYGSRFVAREPMRVGVVAGGYADGYPRQAPDGTPVLVEGVRVPIAGRVSMDMITVDLSLVPQAQVGSSVELWGAQLPIDEVAAASNTVGYELMCALARRVPVTELD